VPGLPSFGDDLDRELRKRVQKEARWLFAEARKELDARRKGLAGREPETAWYQCLLFPLSAWPILVGLAVAWATLTAVSLATVPEVWDPEVIGLELPLLLTAFALLAYTCAFFRCVLASATAGEACVIRWPGCDLGQILGAGVAFVLAFLAGPVVPAVVAVLFWLHSGDLLPVDQLILAELGLVTVGYWTLVLLAVQEKGRLKGANPLAVIDFARRLGWRGWLAVVLIALGGLAHLSLAAEVLEDFHRNATACVYLTLLAFSGPAWVVFLLRWFGLSRFWARQRRPGDRKRPAPDQGVLLSTPAGSSGR
jgi:hypothetical protein